MTAGPSLYDMLLGQICGEPIDAHDDRTLECLSIQQNVRRILNTRAGALKHLPDYGLPDLTNIYKALPASAHVLKQQMEATLLKYEPRIRSIDGDEPLKSLAVVVGWTLRNPIVPFSLSR